MPRLAHNHAVLVANVYPSEPGEAGPKPSALSLLTFYAQSKPQKLTKVGAYLERRVKADLRLSRVGHVEVSLEIVNTLIQNCSGHIGIMSESILTIIADVLGSPDPDLMLGATKTFVQFNSYHNHDSLVNANFRRLYSNLVSRFCKYCAYETSDSAMEHKMHIAGLHALKAITASESFLSSPQLGQYVGEIVPAILINIREERQGKTRAFINTLRDKRGVQDKDPQPPSMDPPSPPANARRTSIADDLFTEALVELNAEASLGQLFASTNATNIKVVLGPVFHYFDTSKEWRTAGLSLHVVQILIGAIQPQFHSFVLSAIMDRLTSSTFTHDVKVKLALVQCLIYVVIFGGASVSVAAIELLDALVGELTVQEKADGVDAGSADREYVDGILDAVGALAVHMDYPTQLNDILSFLVNRMRIVEPSSNVDETLSSAPTPSPDLSISRKVILECLLRVVDVRRFCVAELALRLTDSSASTPIPDVGGVGGGGGDLGPRVAPGPAFLQRAILVSFRDAVSVTGAVGGRPAAAKRSSIVVSPAPVAAPLVVLVAALLRDADARVRLATALFLCRLLELERTVAAPLGGSAIGWAAQMDDAPPLVAALAERAGDRWLAGLGTPRDTLAIGCLLRELLLRTRDATDPVRGALPLCVQLVFKVQEKWNTALAGGVFDAALAADVFDAVAALYDVRNLAELVRRSHEAIRAAGISPLPDRLTDLVALQSTTAAAGIAVTSLFDSNRDANGTVARAVHAAGGAIAKSDAATPPAALFDRAAVVEAILAAPGLTVHEATLRPALEADWDRRRAQSRAADAAAGAAGEVGASGGAAKSASLFSKDRRLSGMRKLSVNAAAARSPSMKSTPRTPIGSEFSDLNGGSPAPTARAKPDAKALLREISGSIRDAQAARGPAAAGSLRDPRSRPAGGGPALLGIPVTDLERAPSATSTEASGSATSSVAAAAARRRSPARPLTPASGLGGGGSSLHPALGAVAAAPFRAPSPLVSLSLGVGTDAALLQQPPPLSPRGGSVGGGLRHAGSRSSVGKLRLQEPAVGSFR
ncbi:hypothetical protein HK405_003944 [Cladochytrium tenue]|nr:hypothetical protein HK405_003944 [Cladochytrium tenue]